MTHRRRGILGLTLACACLALAAVPAAQAATFAVTTTDDAFDVNPGDTVCNANSEGPPACTLRAAVQEANALAGGDRITVPDGDYHLFQADVLTISSDLQIIGASARTVTVRQTTDVDTGEGVDRVFDVASGARVTLQGMTIRDGRADATNGFFGGDIRSSGVLTLREVTVTRGLGDSAGGVANVGGTLTVERSTISDNRAPADAGSGGDAGGILNFGSATDPGSLIVETSTISSNTARLVAGIFSYGNDGNSVDIANSTIAGNQSGDRGGGGGIGINQGSATVENTIVSDNTSPNDLSHPNCSTALGLTITSLGHNLESGTDCGFTSTGDLQNEDPLLGRLANNGGETDTHSLISLKSPAVDAANDATCLAADQRGFFRPQGPHCDIGAYEVDQPPDTSFTAGPNGRTNDPTPTFRFISNEPDNPRTPFECRVDAAASFTPCSSPLTLGPLADGSHTVRVRAIDETGNLDPTPAVRAFRVDTVAPPAPTLTDSDPNSPNNINQPELKGTAETESTVSIFTTAGCTGAPVATGTAAQFTSTGITVNVPDNTTRVFRATATDVAGNRSPCSGPFTYVEDSDPPNTNLSGPTGVTGDATPTLSFSSDEAGVFQCRFDSDPFALCTSPHTSPNALSDGPHTFEVRARDVAGNLDPSPARRLFIVDTGPPNTTIDSGPSGLTNDSTPTFDFGSDESGVTFECRVDAAPVAPCPSPHTTEPLGDGPHVLEVEAVDAAGNHDPTRASVAFTVDARPPETIVLNGPGALTTDSTPTFEFSSDEPGSAFQCSLDDGAFLPCSSPFTPQALSAGRHSFLVRAIDAAGNVDQSPALLFDTGSEFTLIGDPAGSPELGRNFDVKAVSGEVFVSVPAGAAVAKAGAAQLPPGYQPPVKGRVFVPLEEVRELPMGSLVDTRSGVSQLTTARNRAGRTQTGKFSAGVFQVLQSRARKARGLTNLRLKGGSFRSCRTGAKGSGKASAAALRRRAIRRTRANTHGRFGTTGRGAAGTSRGTIWEMIDRCDGTLTKVKRGSVVVRDFRERRNVIVRAGKSYLARTK